MKRTPAELPVDPWWGLCKDGYPAHRCARITPEGLRCMSTGHGTGPRYADGRYEDAGERPIPLESVQLGGRR